MKERYNSEKKAKHDLDGFQMSFDNEAFDKFTAALDQEEKKRRFVWWIFLGRIVLALLLLSFVVYSLVDVPNRTEDSKLSNAIDLDNEAKNIEKTNTKDLAKPTSPTVNINTPIDALTNDNSYGNIGDNRVTTTPIPKKKKQSSFIGTGANIASTKNEISSQIYTQPSVSGNHSMDDIDNEKIKQNEGNSIIENIDLLDILNASLVERKNENRLSFDGMITPFQKKFDRYFYLNLGFGSTIEDNIANRDPFFVLDNTREQLWRATIAYQLNERSAIEFSILRKSMSIGYRLKEFNYSGKVGNRLNILKLGLSNRIWKVNSKISLNMTNSIGMIIASGALNEGFSFSKTQGSDTPQNISNIRFDWEGLYSSNHLLYTGGLSLDYTMSRNWDLSFGADYTIGFKPIVSADLRYIEGEGLLRKMKTHSNSSFATFSFGIKYRFQ